MDRQWSTGAVRDSNQSGGSDVNNGMKGRMDLLPWNAIEAVSVHCQYGAEHYGERNIDKGIPISNLEDSCIRHCSEILRGYDNEDHKLPLWHYRAAAWNALWALEFAITRPDLIDVPWEGGDDQCYSQQRSLKSSQDSMTKLTQSTMDATKTPMISTPTSSEP